MCLAANIPALAAIPASVLGYSATFGYLLQTPDKLSTDVLLGLGWDNPICVISFSLLLGVEYYADYPSIVVNFAASFAEAIPSPTPSRREKDITQIGLSHPRPSSTSVDNLSGV
jgi:hypothetical protein